MAFTYEPGANLRMYEIIRNMTEPQKEAIIKKVDTWNQATASTHYLPSAYELSNVTEPTAHEIEIYNALLRDPHNRIANSRSTKHRSDGGKRKSRKRKQKNSRRKSYRQN